MLRHFNASFAVTLMAAMLLTCTSASAIDAPTDTEHPKDPKLAKYYRELAEAEKERQNKAAQETEENSPPGDPFGWALTLTIPGPGQWEWIGGAADGSIAFFSTKRNAMRAGAEVTVWIRAEFRDHQSPRSTASWMKFNCSKNTSQTLHQMQYGEPDLNKPTETLVIPTVVAPILPGTAAEAWLQWACENIKPKPVRAKPPATQ